MTTPSRRSLTGLSLLLTAVPAWANDPDDQDLFDLSLEELMRVRVVTSTSKRPETSFEAPLSTSVLYRREILRSGATSIPEALRLVPGVIVREQSPGNYDVHLRGLDYLPSDTILLNAANDVTLVMVDDRIVYNHFSGGTPWEALPVDLVDVERIEVIRGPASALYGPNAVAGVIHVITREPGAGVDGYEVDLRGGAPATGAASGIVPFAIGDRVKGHVSTNYQQRERHETEYWEFVGSRFIEDPASLNTVTPGGPIDDPGGRYPDPDLAQERLGVNAFARVELGTESILDVALGFQDSRAQKIYTDIDATPFTTVDQSSSYLQLRGTSHGVTTNVSFETGEQEVLGVPQFQYDYDVFAVNVQLPWRHDRLRLRPEIGYRHVAYDGLFLAGRETLGDASLALGGEYDLDPVRLTGAVRVDKFDTHSSAAESWQFAGTWKVGPDLLLRGGVGHAHRSPFMIDTFANLTFPLGPTTALRAVGDEDLELLSVSTGELGLRSRLGDDLTLDVELFQSRSEDYDDVFADGSFVVEGATTVFLLPYQNIPLEAEQTGLTASLEYADPEDHANTARIFGTLQETELENHRTDPTNPATQRDRKHLNTPTFYGGAEWNRRLADDWNLNLSCYFMSETVQRNQFTRTDVDARLIVNGRLEHTLSESTSLYLDVRNLLDADEREFGFADEIGATVLLGMRVVR